MNRTSLACLLNFIAGWLAVAAFGLMAFVVFLDWCGVHEGLRIFTVIAGLLGLGYWLTSGTGLGFLVSGPRDRGALGLSIATAGVAGLHLMLIIVSATTRGFGEFGGPNTPRSSDVSWASFITQCTALPVLLFFEIAWSDIRVKISENAFLPVVTNLLEVGRMILFLLTLRAVMLCARDSKAASVCMKAMIGFASGAGGLLVLGILFGLMLLAMRPDNVAAGNIQTVSAIGHLFFLALYLILAGLMVGVTLIVKSVKAKIDYRR